MNEAPKLAELDAEKAVYRRMACAFGRFPVCSSEGLYADVNEPMSPEVQA